MTLKELLAKQQAIVDAAKAAHRDLTEEEQRSFDEYQAQIDALQPGGEPDDTAARAAAAERTRITNITAMCRDFGLDAEPLRSLPMRATSSARLRLTHSLCAAAWQSKSLPTAPVSCAA